MPESLARSQSEATSVHPETSAASLPQPTLADLTARVTALERIAQIEECLTRLENRKHTSEAIDDLIDQLQLQLSQ